jgi:hypothetical protein
VKVHGSTVTGFEVKHPRAKIVSFEKMNIPDFFFAGLADLLIQTNEIHNLPPCSSFYRRLGYLVNPDDRRLVGAFGN